MTLGAAHDVFDVVIALCWFTFFVVWAVSAWFVKRTVERSLGWARLLTFLILIPLVGMARWAPGLHRTMWPRTSAIGASAALLTTAGLAVAVWARAALGRNWSGTIAFKEHHELIQRGPYAYVRHPIYSGLLLMCLGTAVASARLSSFAVLGLALVLLVIKAHYEERLMMRHFPDAYPAYRQRVKGLIPGIW
jgi:protein-S-isoprenylcysteine O-methyltransferase Ste14